MLRVTGLTKRFGGLQAVSQVSLGVKKASIHSLIGPNGAGKTTLLNLISGAFRPDSGQVMFDHVDVTGFMPQQLAALGMVRTFQRTSIFLHMSVLENVTLAIRSREKRSSALWISSRIENDIGNEAADILRSVGLHGKERYRAAQLAHGLQRALDIAIGLALKPKLILMDEPLAGMSSGDRETVADLICKIKNQLGVTVVVVEHDVGMVMRLSDRITVLQEGAVIAEGTPAEIRNHAAVKNAYLKGQFAS